MKPDVSILIPVFNEEASLPALVRTLDAYLGTVSFHAQLVFIDDGSADGSAAYLAGVRFANAEMKIVKLSRNFGSHAALRAGVFHADAERCAFYYVDMPDKPEILAALLAKLDEGAELAYAERVGYRASLASRLFARLVNRYIEPRYPRDGVSIVAFGRKIKKELNQNIESDSSIFFQLFQLGFRQGTVPTAIAPRAHGKSSWTFKKKLKLLIDSFVMFSYMPIRFISAVALIMMGLGVVSALAIIVIKVFALAPLQAGWPTLISLLTLGFGITNLSLAVLSEYLVRTLSAARKRPVFIVDEVLPAPAAAPQAENPAK